VITALLNVGLQLAGSGQSDPGRDPVSAIRFWLQQLIRNRQPEAGSAPLNLPIPAPTHDSDNPNTWALLIGCSLRTRLMQLLAAAQPAPLLSELSAWLNAVPELHRVFGDYLMQVFAKSTYLCPALTLPIATPTLPLELRQRAGAIINLLMMNGARDGLFSDQTLCGWELRAFISGLLQLVAGRERGSDNGSGDSQGGAGQAGARPTAAQAAAKMAAHLLVVFAAQDLRDMQPSCIAAQPGAAASIVGGLRACLRQLAASSNNSPSTPPHALAYTLTTLANLCYVVGAVALAQGEHGGSTWAAFMLRLAPLRDLITLITSGGPITGEVPAAIRTQIAFGLYAVAAKHAAVVLQQQQGSSSSSRSRPMAVRSRQMSRQRYSTTAWRQPCAC